MWFYLGYLTISDLEFYIYRTQIPTKTLSSTKNIGARQFRDFRALDRLKDGLIWNVKEVF